jgi:uncharacterized membrane protein
MKINQIIYFLFPFLLFFLAVTGQFVLRTFGENSLVLALLVATTVYAAFVYLSHPDSNLIYVLALFSISFSILLCFNLRTNYVFGCDINLEYYEFGTTYATSHWIPSSLYSSCLSITILPAILSSLTGINGLLIFKFMYPLILSFLPVVMFTIYRRWLGGNLSFVLSMFFVASTIYLLQMPSLARQIIGMFFFILTISFLMNSNSTKSWIRTFLFVLLSFGVIASHYVTGIMLIFTLFLLACYPYMHRLLGKMMRRPNREACFSLVPFKFFGFALFLGLLWYGFVTIIPGRYMIFSAENIINSFKDFWNLTSRSRYALDLVGITPRVGLPNIIGYWVGNIIRGFIFLGLLSFLIRKTVRKNFRIKNEFFLLASVSVLVLLSSVILPYVTIVYNLDRLYLSLLIFMLPFFAVGVFLLSPSIHRIGLSKEKSFRIILTLIIVAQMFFSTGLLGQIVGIHSFVVLNKFDTATKFNDLSPDSRYYIFDEEATMIHWLTKYIPVERFGKILSDPMGKWEMTSVGQIPFDSSNERMFVGNSSDYLNNIGSYFFLRYETTKYNKVYVGTYIDITAVVAKLQDQNRICDNEISQTYQIASVSTG